MRSRTCHRYCRYGIIVFIGYLVMQGLIRMNKELTSDTEENEIVIRKDASEKDGGDKNIVKMAEDEEEEKPFDHNSKREELNVKYDQSLNKAEEETKSKREHNQHLNKAEEEIKAKEKALKLEHELREEEERRHKLELRVQEELLHKEEEKRKKLEKEEEERRLTEVRKEQELREELIKLQKELEKKNAHPVGPGEDVPHHPDDDHHADEHYKYLYIGKGKDVSPVHGRHFAMKATKIEHEMEEQVEKHMEQLPEHRFPTIVTAVTEQTFHDVEKLIDSLQYFLPDKRVVIFHIDLDDKLLQQLASACNVETRLFWNWMFPAHVYNSSHMSWKPVILQMALAEFGSVMWINPTTRLMSSHFAPLLADAEKSGFLVLSTRKQYSTFSVTHPNMYSYIPTDMSKIMESSHLNMRVLIVHNTHEIQENLFKWLILCSLEKECLAPTGSRQQCDFPLKKDTYGNCHQFEESALNILVKNYFAFHLESFNREDSFTMNSADWRGQLNIRRCQ